MIITRHFHREAQPDTWLGNMLSRKPSMLVRVALAHKMAWIVWALMARGGVYNLWPWQRQQPSELKTARSSLAQQS